MTRVMGLDLSITATGVALPSGQLVTIRPTQGAGDKRLGEIRRAITYYIEQTDPEVVAVESIPTAGNGFNVAIILGMVHGVVRDLLSVIDLPFAYVDNKILKKYATGSGAADKRAMVAAAINVGAEPKNDDEADAWWLRAAGRHHYNEVALSTQHALARDLITGRECKVKWPDLRPSARTNARPEV